jgi:GcrA cell cycle regulator
VTKTSDSWGTGDVEKVEQLILDGYSMSGVAAVMHVTRSAAIGRIHRNPDLMALFRRVRPVMPKRKAPTHSPKPQASPPRPAGAVPVIPPQPRRTSPAGASPAPAIGLGVPIEPVPVYGASLPLLKLTASQCHFPVAEDHAIVGGFLFCAAPVRVAGAVYCGRHALQCRSAEARRVR